MQRGAKVTSKDTEDNTPLHFAAKKGWTSIAKKLMEHQCMPIEASKEGVMPLELAIKNDHNECATFLVRSMQPLRY